VRVSDCCLLVLRDAEVEHLDAEVAARFAGEEQIRRLQIPVHDAGGVCLCDRLRCLEYVADRVFDRGAPLLLDDLGEVGAEQVLHHHVGSAVPQRSHVDHPSHVLALDANGSARLTQEALGRLAMFHVLFEQELDRDLTLERQVRRQHHDAHATRAEHTVHAVLVRDDIPLLDRGGQLLFLHFPTEPILQPGQARVLVHAARAFAR
jgi:hypothetical protein